MPNLMQLMFGQGDRNRRQSLLTPEQERFMQDTYNGGGLENNATYGAGNEFIQQLLSNSPEAYAAFEKPLMQNFEQNIVPGIAERFAGMGTGSGAGGSSALYNSLAQAGRNLQTDIGALRGNMQMQALPQALQYAQQPYANRQNMMNVRGFENQYQPGNYGLVGGLAQGAGQGLGMGGGGGIMKLLQQLIGGGM